jgi:hypothetical protein
MPISGQVKNPFGAAEVIALTATGAQAITVVNELTYIDGQTVQATGSRTINLTIDTDNINIGARLIVASKTAATETTVFGTNITGATITGVAGKTKVTEFVYNGSAYINSSTPVQID